MLPVITVIVCLWLYHMDHRGEKPPKPPLPPDQQEKMRYINWVFLGMFGLFGLWYLWGFPKDDLYANDLVVFCKLMAPPMLIFTYLVVSFWLIDRKVDRKYQNLRDYQNLRARQNMPEMEEEMPGLDDPSEVSPPAVPPFGERGDLR